MTFPVVQPRARLLAWATVAMLAVGACSSAATPTPPTPAPATPAAATPAPATSAPASSAPASSAPASPSEAAGSPGNYTLTVVTGAGTLGKYMTGEGDKTLYIFKADTVGSGKSSCSGSCADNWPPFVLEGSEKAVGGAGVSGAIATITRDDGKKQVTYNGAPLYYFAGDQKAGDTNGQGLNAKWFVAAP
jgi:predicted lipoprotein with Yx(FWY)xxD motif